MESFCFVKCHKCRHILTEGIDSILKKPPCDPQCSSYNLNMFIHLQEDQLPNWIKLKVEEEQWTKGKLHCDNCGSKVGSFDFISGRKCECRQSILPPVHFISSQVDRPILNTGLINDNT